MDSLPILSIIIPTVGRGEILLNTLEAAFKAIELLPVEVILVDDSKNGLDLKIPYPAKLLRSGGKGASFARNKGWREARSKLLLFMDDDILIESKHIERTLRLHESDSYKAYNFFWVYPDFLMKQLPNSKFGKYILEHELYSNSHRLTYNIDERTDLFEEKGLTSQYFSIEKRWMEAVNGYDAIPYAGIEDLLLYKKLQAAGVSVYLSRRDVIYQDESNRLSIESLVNRYRTGALTRRVAVEMGHHALGLNFSSTQRLLGSFHTVFGPLASSLSAILPYGFVYRKSVNAQLFFASYKGFYEDSLPRK